MAGILPKDNTNTCRYDTGACRWFGLEEGPGGKRPRPCSARGWSWGQPAWAMRPAHRLSSIQQGPRHQAQWPCAPWRPEGGTRRSRATTAVHAERQVQQIRRSRQPTTRRTGGCCQRGAGTSAQSTAGRCPSRRSEGCHWRPWPRDEVGRGQCEVVAWAGTGQRSRGHQQLACRNKIGAGVLSPMKSGIQTEQKKGNSEI